MPWASTSPNFPFSPHIPPRAVQKVFSDLGRDFGKYETFSCIRDPFSRLVSLYRMIQEVDKIWKIQKSLGFGTPRFSSWVKSSLPYGKGGGGWQHQKWRQFGAWSTQEWISDQSGEVIVRNLIPMSRISTVVPEIFKKYGIEPKSAFPNKNSRSNEDHLTWYTDDLMRLVETRYDWDIKELNRLLSK